MNTEHTNLSQIKATISKYEKENKKLREKISANENAEESEEYKNTWITNSINEFND